MGQYRDDRANVFLDGNSNLVIRATRNDGKYVSGKLVSTFRTGINHTFEARVKLDCLDRGLLARLVVVERQSRARR